MAKPKLTTIQVTTTQLEQIQEACNRHSLKRVAFVAAMLRLWESTNIKKKSEAITPTTQAAGEKVAA